MDSFAKCLGARGKSELNDDRSKKFKTDVDIEKQGVNLLIDWKDKLEQKYEPVPNACTERRIIELCYAVTSNTLAKEIDCNSVGTSPSVNATASAAPTAAPTGK